jgi:hypothetical protein
MFRIPPMNLWTAPRFTFIAMNWLTTTLIAIIAAAARKNK